MNRRRGVSLVELLVVISLIGTILSGIAVAFTAMSRVERRIRDETQTADVLDRLGGQFREDVHRSRTADVAEDGQSVVLAVESDRTIQYAVTKNSISRTVQEKGRIRHRESFAFPTEFAATWSISESRLLTLTVRRRLAPRTSGLDVWRDAEIVAAAP